MRLKFCVACGSKEDLQHHHLVPRAEGGGDEEINLITLCFRCHLKLHERQRNGTYNASQRTIAGLAAAKARGVVLGNPAQAKANAEAAAARDTALRDTLVPMAGLPSRTIADKLNQLGIPAPRGGAWSHKTVLNILARLGLGRSS